MDYDTSAIASGGLSSSVDAVLLSVIAKNPSLDDAVPSASAGLSTGIDEFSAKIASSVAIAEGSSLFDVFDGLVTVPVVTETPILADSTLASAIRLSFDIANGNSGALFECCNLQDNHYLCCPDSEHSYAYESQCLNVFQNIDESYVTATNVAMHYSVPSAIYNDAVSSAEIVSDVCQCNDPSNAIYYDGAISAETE